jgi:CubicO group peptidase (beta-lactamase class C family)
MTRRIILAAILLCRLAIAQLPAEKIKKIEQLVTTEMARNSVPGISMAIAVDGKIQWTGGFGMADLENFVPMTADTRVRLASISKPMTAIAVMQLVEQGKIDLDAPIRRYVPQFPEKPWTVTVRQLMSHTAGIRGYLGNEMSSTVHYGDHLTPMSVFANDPLLFEPGTKYSYSTYGYTVIGAMLEALTHERLADYLHEHVFAPAGMDTIVEDSVYKLIPHRARGYQLRPNGVVENCDLADTSNKVAGGGLISAAADLVKFALALNKLVKPTTLKTMWTAAQLPDGTTAPYGLGFEIRQDNGMTLFGHTGGQRGATTNLVILPEKGIIFGYMMNLESAHAMTPISRGLREILLN